MVPFGLAEQLALVQAGELMLSVGVKRHTHRTADEDSFFHSERIS